MLLGVDVGGTFTDAVCITAGQVFTAKSPTTPADQSLGVMRAIERVLALAGGGPNEVEEFAHGTTVATNALLENKVARTAFIATAGFTDIIELGRQARADLYRLCASHPPPLAPPELRVPAHERMSATDILQPLSDHGVAEIETAITELAPEAVAVCLLHSYRDPTHELQIGERLRSRFPELHISLSHEVVGTFREFERAATTEIDAALSPLLRAYLQRLAVSALEHNLPVAEVMQSSGGLASTEQVQQHAALAVLSGPAGGAAGARWVAQAANVTNALCFDMGGTSCDVCVIADGEVRQTSGRKVGGRPITLPMLDLETVGAGGGSIAWRDPGGALRVGPQSAGAEPGPACYALGGKQPTVTDANLLLGYLADGARLGDTIELDAALAQRAVAELAQSLSMTTLECARGIHRIANAEMVRAMRVMTVQRGVDPRELELIAFGGAGPLHACAIAEELGISAVLCPRAAGVLAAFGLVASERRRDVQRTVMLTGDEITQHALDAHVAELSQRTLSEIGHDTAAITVTGELRYKGQSFELPVSAGSTPTPENLKTGFVKAHESEYGYSDPTGEIELVTLRVTASVSREPLSTRPPDSTQPIERTTRTAIFADNEVATEIIKGQLAPGRSVEGPAICELPETTVVIAPGWNATVEENDTLRLESQSK